MTASNMLYESITAGNAVYVAIEREYMGFGES
jgi:hypothetical protein